MTDGRRYIKIFLLDGIFYSGRVISEDENFIVISDKFNERVSINKKAIRSMSEVSSR